MSRSTDPFLIDSHKMQFHPQRIAQWMDAKTLEQKLEVYPIYVEISPVGHCNHRCTFCAVDYIGYKVRKLDTDKLCSALLEMSVLGVKSVMFAGEGEPMLHPDIAVITNYAAGVGIDVSFTTNGTALTKKFVDGALKSVKWIKVSMNGGPKSYAKIHQCKEEDYERVWSNISYALSHDRQTTIGIQCVVLPDNIEDLKGLVQRAKEVGVEYVVLKPYSQHKSSLTNKYAFINYRQVQDHLTELQALSTEKFKVIARTQAMEDWDGGEHTYHTCSATPYFWAYVMATGDVYSCSAYLLNDEFNMGNIHATTFKKIWEGEKRARHIKSMENLDISKCRLNCRMHQVNKYLDRVVKGNPHASFI